MTNEAKNHTEVINIPNVPLNLKFDTKGLKKLIILPDYSPSREGLDVGTVAVFDKNSYRFNPKYLGQDIGCGMALARFESPIKDLEDKANEIAGKLMGNKECIGSLGGGNHFITIYEVAETEIPLLKTGDYVCAVHSGSRGIEALSFDKEQNEKDFLESQNISIDYARGNRKALLNIIEEASKTKLKTLFDRMHNFLEFLDENAVYRKGAVKIMPRELTLLTSSLGSDALILRAKENVSEIEYSLPHGTGRKVSRREAREKQLFLEGFPKEVYIPYFIYPENLATEMPSCYRRVSEVYPLIEKYAGVVGRLIPKSSIMI